MKRLLALVAGGLGLGAILKRRSKPAPLHPSPAEELRAKLAVTKEPEPLQPEIQPAAEATVDDRRADVHARARQAMQDLGEA
jgi:hypothetical protein